jgi:CheY-like chemotaxis protein
MQTILIVDDEPVIRTLLELVLHRAGFSVLTAGCGCEALSVSQSHHGEIALLITDITLPGISGWKVAEELLESEPNIPVLYISGGCLESGTPACGRSQFLSKPFSLSTLVSQVRDLLINKKEASDVS